MRAIDLNNKDLSDKLEVITLVLSQYLRRDKPLRLFLIYPQAIRHLYTPVCNDLCPHSRQ
jgi:hypothetical protein